MRPAHDASAPARSSSGAGIRPRQGFPRREVRRCAGRLHFPARQPAGPNLCYAWTLTSLRIPARESGTWRQFAGEDEVAWFISQIDDATILIAILALLRGFWKARLLTEVWTRK